MNIFRNIYKKNMKLAAVAALCILFFSNSAYAAIDPTEEIGPGIIKAEEPKAPEPVAEKSLGMYTTTGYCNCKKCSSGSGLTYSGTTPQANHTISADISILPLGTKVRINDIIYTVEDIGSSVKNNKLDIYYATHKEASAHGRSQAEVFLVE